MKNLSLRIQKVNVIVTSFLPRELCKTQAELVATDSPDVAGSVRSLYD